MFLAHCQEGHCPRDSQRVVRVEMCSLVGHKQNQLRGGARHIQRASRGPTWRRAEGRGESGWRYRLAERELEQTAGFYFLPVFRRLTKRNSWIDKQIIAQTYQFRSSIAGTPWPTGYMACPVVQMHGLWPFPADGEAQES